MWGNASITRGTVSRGRDGATLALVATTSSSYASLFILDTGEPAMALGGYHGCDRILAPAQLARMVSDGMVRFFYLPPASNCTPAPRKRISWPKKAR
jgi:hypothetical protein